MFHVIQNPRKSNISQIQSQLDPIWNQIRELELHLSKIKMTAQTDYTLQSTKMLEPIVAANSDMGIECLSEASYRKNIAEMTQQLKTRIISDKSFKKNHEETLVKMV